ncbi:MAG: hypothetical protein AAF821_11840 [Cyanobacteria bacterium P01_D01_bin.156]
MLYATGSYLLTLVKITHWRASIAQLGWRMLKHSGVTVAFSECQLAPAARSLLIINDVLKMIATVLLEPFAMPGFY